MTDETEAQADSPAVMLLEVTNQNDFEINDMFNGVPAIFPKGAKVEVTPDIAAHCFGWPGEDSDRAMHMARRYGWGGRENLAWKPGTRLPLYHEWAMKVEIKPIYFKLERFDPNAPIPADTGDDPDGRPRTPRLEGEASGTRSGRRNKQAPRQRRIRDRHETSERVR